MRALRDPRNWALGASALFLLGCALFRLGPYLRARWAGTGPHLVCDAPAFDFGDVPTGQTVRHTFVLWNRGDQPLELPRARADCGCRIEKPPDAVVPPGASTLLTAAVPLKGLRGPQRRNVLVWSSDPRKPFLVLRVQGTATSEIGLRPARVNFGALLGEVGPPKTVEVTATGATLPLQILGVSASQPGLVEARLETVEAGKAYRVHVSLKQPLPLGRLQAVVRVRTNSPVEPEVTIPVSAISGEFLVQPEQVVLGQALPGPEPFWLTVRAGKAFKITHVEPPTPLVEVTVLPLEKEKGYRVGLSKLPAGKELHGKKLRITTDGNGARLIEVPFRWVGPN
jgi:hypothetical protein